MSRLIENEYPLRYDQLGKIDKIQDVEVEMRRACAYFEIETDPPKEAFLSASMRRTG